MSNNGSQHLSLLTKDEVTGPLVNLVPQELPGDLYAYIAEDVWKSLEEKKNALGSHKIKECEEFIDRLVGLKKEIYSGGFDNPNRVDMMASLKAMREANQELIKLSAPIWWCRIKDKKEKRKIVKR